MSLFYLGGFPVTWKVFYRNATLLLVRSQLTPAARLWGMFEAWEQWREVAIKRGMVAIKKEEWEISQQKGCLRYVNWPRSLLTVTWPPCSCFPSDLRPTLHCLSICNQPPSPKIATLEIWEARFLNHTFWSGQQPPSIYHFIGPWLGVRPPVKMSRFYRPFLREDHVQISGRYLAKDLCICSLL